MIFRKFFTTCAGTALLLLPVVSGAADGPVSVQETVNATLRSHHGLKSIQENRDAIVHELRRAKAGWGPSVDITGRYGASELSNSTTRASRNDHRFYDASSIGVTLVQPLWDGWATRSRVRSTEATLDSMSDRVMDNATSYGLDAVIAHIDVLRRREILRLSEQNVERHRQILGQTRERQNLGADTMADVSQTQGRLARALSTLSEAQQALREGEEAYRRITQTPVPSMLVPVGLPMRMYEGAEPVFEVAKQENPALKAYLNDIRASRADQELTQANYHPQINLEIGPSYSDRGGKNDQWTKSFEVMGTMRWNIFNSGADLAADRAAASRVRQSRELLYNYYDDLQQEIADTWTAYIAAQEQHQHYLDAISYNTRTRDAYIEQFVTGQRSLLDVLDSESELFNSSTQAVTAEANIVVAMYRLHALAGTLLTELNVDTSNILEAPHDTSMPEGAKPF